MNEFDRVVIVDGSSFALRDDLAEIYPGRFNQYKPAAVELHTTLELFDRKVGVTESWGQVLRCDIIQFVALQDLTA